MRKSKARLVLGRSELIAMTRLTDLYELCPELLPLKPLADDAAASSANAGALCCGRDWSFYADVVRRLSDQLRLHRSDRDFVDRLRSVLAKRLGYSPQQIVVYYRPVRNSKAIHFVL